MPLAKRLADTLTMSRLAIFCAFLWLGLEEAKSRLPLAIVLLILSWTSDAFDGPLARRSHPPTSTWLGDHDLEIDMLVSVGVLVYLLRKDFISAVVVYAYILLWGIIFWRYGNFRSLGMLFQAPIYAWFIVISMREAPSVGIWLMAWIAVAVIVTWPRFPNLVIPGFLQGMKEVWIRRTHK